MDSKPYLDNFPLLSTPRLILRNLRPTDLDDLYEYASDPEIIKYGKASPAIWKCIPL